LLLVASSFHRCGRCVVDGYDAEFLNGRVLAVVALAFQFGFEDHGWVELIAVVRKMALSQMMGLERPRPGSQFSRRYSSPSKCSM